jgi:hypothetical protein
MVIAMANLRAWMKRYRWREESAGRKGPWRADGVAMSS